MSKPIRLYKITDSVDGDTFYGSTTQLLSSRFASIKREVGDAKYDGAVYKHMRLLGGENFKIELVEVLDATSRDTIQLRIQELETRSKHITRQFCS